MATVQHNIHSMDIPNPIHSQPTVSSMQINTVECQSATVQPIQPCTNSQQTAQLNDQQLQRASSSSVHEQHHQQQQQGDDQLYYDVNQMHAQYYQQQQQQYGWNFHSNSNNNNSSNNGYQQCHPHFYNQYQHNGNMYHNNYYQQHQTYGYPVYQHHRNPYSQHQNKNQQFGYPHFQGCQQYMAYPQLENYNTQVMTAHQTQILNGLNNQGYHQFSQKKQRCGRQFRGRGWHKGSHRHHHKKRQQSTSSSSSASPSKHKEKCQKKTIKQNQQSNRKKVEAQSGSSSSDQLKLLEGKMDNLNINQQKKIEQFISCMKPFFEKNNIKQKAQYKIGKYLSKKFIQLQQLDPLISVLYGLEAESPQIFTNPDYTLFIIVKQIINKNYNIEAIKQSLAKKSKIKQKRLSHDLRFQQQYPDAAELDFLELEQLLQLNLDKTLFLVDGNNIMPKQKVFRKYFYSDRTDQKAEGQIRLQWLLSQSIKSQVFFDNQYDQKLYKDIKYDILSNKEQQNLAKVPIHFADKKLHPGNTADMKIVSRLSEIAENSMYQGYTIVLVSADQELGQLCNAIYPLIKKTSGMYIFKFCKRVIKKKYYHNPEMKGIIRDIFLY